MAHALFGGLLASCLFLAAAGAAPEVPQPPVRSPQGDTAASVAARAPLAGGVLGAGGLQAGPASNASRLAAQPLRTGDPVRGHGLLASMIKVLAVGGSYSQHLSPLRSVLAMRRKGSSGNADAAPYLTLACNCAHWCSYGILGWLCTGNQGSLVVFAANLPGSVLGMFYSASFWICCDCQEGIQRLQLGLQAVAAVVALEVMAVLLLPGSQALHLVGSACTVLSISVAASPLLSTRTVLRTRSVESMPVDLAMASLASATIWVLCGLVLKDHYVTVTNSCNALAATLSVLLIVRFHPRTRSFWEGTASKLDQSRELDDLDSGIFLRTPLRLDQAP